MNDIPLRDWIDQRLADERRYYDQRFDGIAEALARVDGQEHISRSEFDQFREIWRTNHADLKTYIDQQRGRWVGVPILVSGAALALTLITVLIDFLHR